MKSRIILLLLVFTSMVFTSCSERPRPAKSVKELQSILTEALREGDTDTVEALSHPATSLELKDGMLKIIKPLFDFKPEKVTPTIIQLTDVPMDLPGELKGRRLRYTTRVDGVIFLDGRSTSERGETEISLYLPYTKTPEGYCLAGVEFGEL